MLEVTSFRSGEVLNAGCGQEDENGLTITVAGIAAPDMKVTVNNLPALRMDRKFSAQTVLTERINRLEVRGESQHGTFIQELTLVWDKNSYKRYTFFIDDNIFALNDIARERPASLFDHFYFSHLKHLHDTYGTAFTLNLFYRDDHDPEHFELKDFPDCYKKEFQTNSSWLRLSFHAYSEFPDRPYQHAAAEKLQADHKSVYDEICRFAGEECYEGSFGVHWGMAHPDNFEVLKKQQVNLLCAPFIDGKVSIDEEENRSRCTDLGYFYEKDVAEYLEKRKIFYDRFHNIFLRHCTICCNLMDKETLRRKIMEVIGSEHNDTLVLMTHEQYCFPRYAAYIPDHLERMELACSIAAELGFRPAWFNRGICGNTAWEK